MEYTGNNVYNIYIYMSVCLAGCLSVCMYVCIYIYMCMYVGIYIYMEYPQSNGLYIYNICMYALQTALKQERQDL